MERAVEACKNGMSFGLAAKTFEVPCSSLRKRVHHGAPTKPHGGHNRKLAKDEEALLADMIKKTAGLGVPFDKPFLRKVVEARFKAKGLSSTWFTRGWFRGFLRRHPTIVARLTHSTNRKKAHEWTQEICTKYVSLLSELHIGGYLDDPNDIWSLDESPFSFSEGVRTVYAERGTREVLSYADGSDRDSVTVLACGNAAGRMLRPLVLFDGKVHLASRFDGTEDDCYIGVNPSGVMDYHVFAKYAEKEVIPSFSSQKNLIVVDEHASHINSIEFLDVCIASGKDIQLLCLPAEQTPRLQPLDAKIFGPIKKYWRDFLREQDNTMNQPVSKQTFAAALMGKWDGFNVENNLPFDFRATGIFPFDPSVIFKTVTPKKCLRVAVRPSDIFRPWVESARAVLSEVSAASAVDVEETISFFVRKIDGTADTAVDLGDIFRKQVMGARPPKKKHVKDSRVDTSAGCRFLKSEFREALLEKLNAKKASTAQKAPVTRSKKTAPKTATPKKERPKKLWSKRPHPISLRPNPLNSDLGCCLFFCSVRFCFFR